MMRAMAVSSFAFFAAAPRRRCGLGLALVLCALSVSARGQDADPWLGPDKALHFGLSAAIASGGYAASALFVDRPELRLAIGAGLALTAGAAKELWDLAGHGAPSWKDFTWDVIGAAVGALVSYALDRWVFSRSGLAFGFARLRVDAIHAGEPARQVQRFAPGVL